MFIIIIFLLVCDRPPELFFRARFTSLSTHASRLPSTSVPLSYLIFAVSMRDCLGKYSCMSSPCPIVILNECYLLITGSTTTTARFLFGAKNRNT